MGRPGQYNYKGINAQSIAAMSLFLQHLKEQGFDHIHLEGDKCEDFDLVFNDGHKIICESKARKQAFNFSDLKYTIGSVLKKRGIDEKDTVLIICSNLNENLENLIEHLRYYPKPFAKSFAGKGFSKKLISYLPRVRFWKVSPQYNKDIIYALFYDLAGIWLPQKRVEELVDNILIQKIYNNSALGGTYTKKDFFVDLNSMVQGIIKDSGTLDRKRQNIAEKILSDLAGAIGNPNDPIWAANNKASLCAQPDLLYFVFDRIKDREYKDLKQWDPLWELNNVAAYSFKIFKIFANNLGSANNRKYVLDYINKHIDKLRGYYRIDFFFIKVTEILQKILDQDDTLSEEIFAVVQKLFSARENDNFFVGMQRDLSYERGKISKLLLNVYEKANAPLKNKIYRYVVDKFNLIEDVGDAELYAPNELYELVSRYISSFLGQTDFKIKFNELVRALSDQYSRYYNKFKITFNGWEPIGSTGSFWGNAYSVSDRKFVETILEPIINKFYDADNKNAWTYIKAECISPEKKVSAKHPDFLNRVSILSILNQYKSEQKAESEEAFKALKEFILSRKGIPNKTELIYQAINCKDYTDAQKWRLLKVSLDKYGIPVNPFVEQIATELACEGHREAKEQLLLWIGKPDYFRTHRTLINVTQNITALLGVDIAYALMMFKKFISTPYFKNKYSKFETYDVARLLYKFLQRKDCYDEAVHILNDLSQKKKLTKNQQIIMCYGFVGEISNEIKGDEAFIERIYNDFVKPYLCKTGNVCKRIPHANAREAFLNFADKLAQYKKPELIKKALFIVEELLDDPDPYLPGKDPEDREDKYNEHKCIENGESPKSIRSVRGRCGWVLMNCAIPAGRKYLPAILRLTERLIKGARNRKEQNWYVKHMATFALAQLAKNRLSIKEKGSQEMFFYTNKEKALKMAKKVESLAFKLLKEVVNSAPNVQKAMMKSVLQPFDHIRALNQREAKELLDTILKMPDEAVAEADALFIFFAEFRKDMYKQCPWAMEGYYNDLAEYDDAWFKEILDKLLSDERYIQTRRKLSWRFWVMPKDYKRDKKQFDKCFTLSIWYLKKAIATYDHDVYEDVYRFINDYIEDNFEDCYSLWISCVEKEKPYFESNVDKIGVMYFWPDYYNGDVLLAIKNHSGIKDFLRWFKYLSDYPVGFNIGNIEDAAKLLVEIISNEHSEMVESIFDNLIKHHPSNYDLKIQWQEKRKINQG